MTPDIDALFAIPKDTATLDLRTNLGMTLLDPDTLARDPRYWQAMADHLNLGNRIWLWTPKTRPAGGPCRDEDDTITLDEDKTVRWPNRVSLTPCR